MSFLAHPLVGVSTGVLLSFLLVLHQCKNPSQIPRSTVWFRAFFGIALFLILWFVFSAAVFVFLSEIPNPLALAGLNEFVLTQADATLRWLGGAVVGFVTPQLLPTEQIVQRKGWSSLSGPLRPFFRHVVAFNEYTRGYLNKIVDREERKIIDAVMGGEVVQKAALAIDRLYEFHKSNIIKNLVANQSDLSMKEKALGLWLHCHTTPKCTLLLRHLGMQDFLASLQTVTGDPARLFPTWSVDRGDERKYQRRQRQDALSGGDRRTLVAYGRRATDFPYARDWILLEDGD